MHLLHEYSAVDCPRINHFVDALRLNATCDRYTYIVNRPIYLHSLTCSTQIFRFHM